METDTTLFNVTTYFTLLCSHFIFPHFNLLHLVTIHSTFSPVKLEIWLIYWLFIPVVAFLTFPALLIILLYTLLHITNTFFFFPLSRSSSLTGKFRVLLVSPTPWYFITSEFYWHILVLLYNFVITLFFCALYFFYFTNPYLLIILYIIISHNQFSFHYIYCKALCLWFPAHLILPLYWDFRFDPFGV